MTGSHTTHDVVAIQQLLHRIAATADLAAYLQDYVRNFTDDVLFEFAEVPALCLAANVYSGHPATLEGAAQRRAAGVQGPGSRTIHAINDIVVTPRADDEAHVHAAWQYFGYRDGHPAVLAMGFYENTVRRVGEAWLLARRVVTVL